MTTVIDPAVGLIQPTGAPLPIAQGGSGGNTGFFAGVVQSMVRVNTANGYGSTNTAIHRWTNTITNQGTDITYADSATLGATFTINTVGVYAISRTDQFSAAAGMGLSLNSTQLTTGINTLVLSTILSGASASAANLGVQVAWVGYLAANSVIRGHDVAGNVSGINTGYEQFTITRVA